MDVNNLLGYLIPIIFLIVWVIGRIFSPKTDDQSESEKRAAGKDIGDGEFAEIFGGDLADEGAGFEEVVAMAKDEWKISEPSLVQSSSDVGLSQRVGLERFEAIKKPKITSEFHFEDRIEQTKENLEIGKLLKSSRELKRAFLACEILSPPLCLRKNGKVGRSWQR